MQTLVSEIFIINSNTRATYTGRAPVSVSEACVLLKALLSKFHLSHPFFGHQCYLQLRFYGALLRYNYRAVENINPEKHRKGNQIFKIIEVKDLKPRFGPSPRLPVTLLWSQFLVQLMLFSRRYRSLLGISFQMLTDGALIFWLS